MLVHSNDNSVINSRLWWPAINLPYKHGVVAYGRNMAYIIDVTAYGGCHKSAMLKRHDPPWRNFNNTTVDDKHKATAMDLLFHIILLSLFYI